jgi:glycosyltransferase involved in cell wall biosynthesis
MKVLIIVDQFKDIDSQTYTNLVKTFEGVFDNNKEYELLVKHIGPNKIWSAEALSKVLLETEFDIAVVSPLWHVHVQLHVAKKLGKKLFIHHWDSHSPIKTCSRYVNLKIFLKSLTACGHTFVHTCREYAQYCNVLLGDYGDGEFEPNIYCMPTPVDPRQFYPIPENEKEHEVLFFGQLSTDERKFFLPAIKNANLPLTVKGVDSYPDWPEFAKTNRKSKINLVLNAKASGEGQRKGKIYEAAACGNLAIVTHPEAYYDRGKYIFEENVHYVSINKQNYIDVIEYYLDHPEERLKISNQLYDHYLKNYSAEAYWYNIFKYSKDK